jgi:tetratricopeptide (TPR) repeat protein
MAADRPTSLDRVYRLGESAEWRHLLDHLRLMEGFGLILLLAPEQAGVDVCRRALRTHFAKRDRSLHCLSLLPGDVAGRLGQHLLHDKVPDDAAAVWVDALAPVRGIGEEPLRALWQQALAALNPQRNPLRRRLRIPLIIAGPFWLQQTFEHAAADLWSIRDTIIRIEPLNQAFGAAVALSIKLDSQGGQLDGEPGDPEETRRALHRLRQHEVPADKHSENMALEARLLQRLGNQLRRLYQWEEAEAALLKAEELMEQNPRSLDDEGRLLFDLSALYDGMGDIARRTHFARKAYEFTNAHFGKEHPNTLASRNDLANALDQQGKHAEAEAEHRAVLTIRERVLGAEHPATLGSRNNLANALDAQGKHAEVEAEHHAVLAIRERVQGAEHPDTLSSRNNLAAALQLQGKHAEAEAEHRAVLAIRERVQGAEHPDALTSRNNLAAALQLQGKNAEAEAEHRMVLAIRARVLGAEHPVVAQSYYNLARCLERQGKKPEALQFARRALEIWQKVLGKEHGDTKDAQRMIARLTANVGG